MAPPTCEETGCTKSLSAYAQAVPKWCCPGVSGHTGECGERKCRSHCRCAREGWASQKEQCRGLGKDMPLSTRALMRFALEKLADKYMYIWSDASDALALPSTRDCESRWVELYALWVSLGCAKYEDLKRGIAADIPARHAASAISLLTQSSLR